LETAEGSDAGVVVEECERTDKLAATEVDAQDEKAEHEVNADNDCDNAESNTASMKTEEQEYFFTIKKNRMRTMLSPRTLLLVYVSRWLSLVLEQTRKTQKKDHTRKEDNGSITIPINEVVRGIRGIVELAPMDNIHEYPLSRDTKTWDG